jgi:3-methylcrotonyl-CoA carboxylase alpha subunit
VVLEAMKMEQTITAPAAGKIDRVMCEVGDQVREGAELLVFATA